MGRDVQILGRVVELRAFQSTRPVWGATDIKCARLMVLPISIHAPRVGRDDEDDWPRMQAWPISIHAPRVGRDSGRLSLSLPLYLFQSTRPVWGATKGASLPASNDGFQSTRPVWGATSLRPRNESKR